MALDPGTISAVTGMAKTIYDQLESAIKDSLDGLADSAKEQIKENWKKLSFAIAKGVTDHIVANMEVRGISTQGNISATVSGTAATQIGVVFSQNNDGTGHIL